MMELANLSVAKNGRTICFVSELSIATGERVVVRGPNGSGKTTLLRVLAGLDRYSQGHLTVAARPQDRVYVHQSPYLFRGNVLANVKYGLSRRGMGRAEQDRLARDWLERLGVGDLYEAQSVSLSGGERRRVALARAMILQPRLLLLDEPFAEMDLAGAACVAAAIAELQECTVLLTSPTEISEFAGRDYVLESPETMASSE